MPDITIDKSNEALMPLSHSPPNAMVVWEFYEAPEWVRGHSGHGGDEDGIIWVPNGVELPWWMERLWCAFACDPDVIKFSDGILIIWAHA